MTNYERYKKDILELKGDFAMHKNTRKVCRCSDIACTNCHFNDFSRPTCSAIKLVWLYEEYVEKDPNIQRLIDLYNTIGEYCTSVDDGCGKCIYGYTMPGYNKNICDYIEDEYDKLELGDDE